MSEGFVCVWKIRHFNFYNSERERCISTPVFTSDLLGEIKWILHLFHDENQVGCYITQEGPRNSGAEISVRFELTNPEGVVVRASKKLKYTFAKSKFSEKCFLVQREELLYEMFSWLEDTVTIRCLMDCENGGKQPVSSCQVTMEFGERYSLLWPFSYSSACVKKLVNLADIPVQISFKCIYSTLKFNFLSDVIESEELFAWFEVSQLNPEDSILVNFRRMSEFRQQNKEDECVLNFSKQKADICNKTMIKCEVLNSFKPMVKYNKTYLGRGKKAANSILTANDVVTLRKGVTESQKLEFQDKRSQNYCEKVLEKVSDSKIEHNNATNHDCLSHLQKHLRGMFLDEKFTDVKLRVDNKTFCAHKSLLAARSPVFSAMFGQDMLESNTGIVEIADLEAKSFESFLEYIYTADVEEMDFEIALDLLVVADKYEVPPLSQKCFNFVQSALAHNNVCEALSIADMINHEQLKLAAIDYIAANSAAVLSSPQWVQWLKVNTTLASEVFLKMSMRFEGGAKK